jgi:hypothetical protein
MSETIEAETQETGHAMLVVWGQFAHCLGIPQAFAEVPMSQKTVIHTPQNKVLEFLVANLAGLPYAKDISKSPQPLDQDQAVAKAWGVEAWADCSGVSRTLHALTETQGKQYTAIVEGALQPWIDQEVQLALNQGRPIELDGDLSPRPVSNGSKTYPGAEYGYMSDGLQLGYQAALVSMRSPTYGRLGLSVTRHSGNTVSMTQAEGLALEAERSLGRRPLRRTDLLAQRIQDLEPEGQKQRAKVAEAEQKLVKIQAAWSETQGQCVEFAQKLADLEKVYQQRNCPERPNSQLAQLRQRAEVWCLRLERDAQTLQAAQARLAKQQTHLANWEQQKTHLNLRLKRFQVENETNRQPMTAIFRLDAGFGNRENLALLIEMGYEIYSKPYGNWLSGTLSKMSATRSADWEKVGKNAEMLAWKAVQLEDFPYPLDLGYERFWQGTDASQPKLAYSGVLHFGPRAVTTDLPGWFQDYNARQTIEAANKESKQVFEVHHIKVRSQPAMRLQEHFALFAANFVRIAAAWLANQCPQVPDGWKESTHPAVKEQVKVGAHSPARIEWFGSDCLLRFAQRSVYAGRSLLVRRKVAIQLTLRI